MARCRVGGVAGGVAGATGHNKLKPENLWTFWSRGCNQTLKLVPAQAIPSPRPARYHLRSLNRVASNSRRHLSVRLQAVDVLHTNDLR